MATVSVTHSLHDLAGDMSTISSEVKVESPKVVRAAAIQGNEIAKGIASQQHTMYGDADALYPPSFTAEQLAPTVWEFGAEASIGDGHQSTGYEFGSIHSPGHYDHQQAADAIGPIFADKVGDMAAGLFWPGA